MVNINFVYIRRLVENYSSRSVESNITVCFENSIFSILKYICVFAHIIMKFLQNTFYKLLA